MKALFALLATAVLVANAAPAPNANSVLMLSTTVLSGGYEITQAQALGFTVVNASPAQWAAMSGADFASYRALILGDPNCLGGETPISGAINTVTVWAPTITGNVIVQGTDPSFHAKPLVHRAFIGYVASIPGKTGLWLCQSCYYHGIGLPGYVPLFMDHLKGPSGGPSFKLAGSASISPGNLDRAHIVASHPALATLTDSYVSNWGFAVHNGFLTWPTAFIPLIHLTSTSGSFSAADGSRGFPYVLARGDLTITGCGPNTIFVNGVCVTCPAGSHSVGGACVCDSFGVFPDCNCGADCAARTVPATCAHSESSSASHCASLSFSSTSSAPCS